MEYPKPKPSNVFNPVDFITPEDEDDDEVKEIECCDTSADTFNHSTLVSKSGGIMSGTLTLPQLSFSSDNTYQTTAFTNTDKITISANSNNISLHNTRITDLENQNEFTDIDKDQIDTNKANIISNGLAILNNTDEINDIKSNVSSDEDNRLTLKSGNTGELPISFLSPELRVRKNDILYGRIGPFMTTTDNFYIYAYQDTDIVLQTTGNTKINCYSNTLSIGQVGANAKIQMNGETQNHCFTDAIKAQIESNTEELGYVIADQDELLVNLVGKYDSFVPCGTILTTARPPTVAPPDGYLYCDGMLVSQTTYADLYAIIGQTYKYDKPSYSNHFYLPDMRQLFVRGSGLNQTYPVSAQPTSVGDFQEQSVMRHGHDYTATQTTESAGDGGLGTVSVAENHFTTQQTEKLYDKDNNEITAAVAETRPYCLTLNYMIKF